MLKPIEATGRGLKRKKSPNYEIIYVLSLEISEELVY